MSSPLIGLILLGLAALAILAALIGRNIYRNWTRKGEAERRQQRIAWARAWEWVHGRRRQLRLTDARREAE